MVTSVVVGSVNADSSSFSMVTIICIFIVLVLLLSCFLLPSCFLLSREHSTSFSSLQAPSGPSHNFTGRVFLRIQAGYFFAVTSYSFDHSWSLNWSLNDWVTSRLSIMTQR